MALALGILQGALALNRYTQSIAFCGQTCHRAMAPQHAAHLAGSHASVPCTSCHVGRGPLAHVRAKVRGAEHLWALLRGNYARPIRVSSTQHRVPSDRCIPCHSLARLPPAKLMQVPRYRYDEANSAWQASLTIRIGESKNSPHQSRGIVWHMSDPSRVSYAAADPLAQSIPWVQVNKPDGSATTYISRVSPLSRAQIEQLPRSGMTCSDCHNRGAHDIVQPDAALDQALFNGEVAVTLPSVKRRLLEALSVGRPAHEAAMAAVRNTLTRTVSDRTPELVQLRQGEIDRALAFAEKHYADSNFFEQRVDWGTHPSHLGHRFSSGCFRCHDGQHVDAEGKLLANDCDTTCHTAPRMSPMTPPGASPDPASAPWHPWQLPILDLKIPGHDRLNCSDCHATALVPKLACEDCHHPPGI